MPPPWKRLTREAKKKLEQKLYLAQERPDDLFDISSCQLDEVPLGTFSIVKVLLKTRLLLNDNHLQSLHSGGYLNDLSGLTVLDISSNQLRSLPDDIGLLVALKVLNVANNRLRNLPNSLQHLKHLVSFSCSDNRLKYLPTTIGCLLLLQELLLDGNLLTSLPGELRYLTSLTKLTLPSSIMTYPPSDVCRQGASAVIDYLTNAHLGVGSESSNSTAKVERDLRSQTSQSLEDDLPTQKQPQTFRSSPHTMSPRLAPSILAQQLDETDRAQQKLTAEMALARQKVLSKVAEENARLHADLAAVQLERDHQRNYLVSTLLTAEDSAAELINQLLASTELNKRMDAQYNDNQLLELPDSQTFKLRRQEVLASMKNTLAATDYAYLDYVTQRDSAIQQSLSQSSSENKDVQALLKNRKRDQERLTSQLADEETIQREAFARLQSQQDEQCRRLVHGISLIERELCRLTLAEQERRAAHTEVNQHGLDLRRADLVRLLDQLMYQRKRREVELQQHLTEMEAKRRQDQMDYWLVQYQRLLDSKPIQLNQPVDDRLHKVLLRAGGVDFEANFRYHQITMDNLKWMTDTDLQKIGVYTLGVRKSILGAVVEELAAGKLTDVKLNEPDVLPSAPPQLTVSGQTEPSSPPMDVVARIQKECCICLAAQCDIIFMQCGHVCTCTQCAGRISLCPLCRGQIVQRVQLQGQ